MAITPDQEETLEKRLESIRLIPFQGIDQRTSNVFTEFNRLITEAMFQAEEPRRDLAKYYLQEAEKTAKPLKKEFNHYYIKAMEAINGIKNEYHFK